MDQTEQKYKCNECGLTFSSEREQREHQEKVHRKGSGQGGQTGSK